VAVPSLAGFKARLDGALSTLGWWKGSLSQLKPFYHSMVLCNLAPTRIHEALLRICAYQH